MPNSEAHRKCRAWFKTVFESHGAKVVMQDFKPKAFDGQILDGMNIIASHNHNAKHRIILPHIGTQTRSGSGQLKTAKLRYWEQMMGLVVSVYSWRYQESSMKIL